MTHEATAARQPLTRYAWLSLAAALTTMALKAAAYAITGSVGLLSDAVESLVNLAAAIIALLALRLAEAPADDEHQHGHEKVEYFSSALEGALITAAAVAITVAAILRLLAPRPLEALGLGAGASAAASLVNLGVARVLHRAGKRHNSIALTADATHLMSDVWTTAALLVGLGLVWLTGWLWLDPAAAIAMAAYIAWAGVTLVYRSGSALLDAALPAADREQITAVLASFRDEGADFHAVRTRQAGRRRFVSFHVLVPGDWSVRRGHDLCERIEAKLRALAPRTTVLSHLEPREDPASYRDQTLDRESQP